MESLLSLLYYGYRDFTFCSLIFAQKFKNPNCLKHAKCSWAILKPKKIIFLCSICETAYETTLWKAWQVYNTCIKLISCSFWLILVNLSKIVSWCRKILVTYYFETLPLIHMQSLVQSFNSLWKPLFSVTLCM